MTVGRARDTLDLVLVIVDDDALTAEMISTTARARGYASIALTDPYKVESVLAEASGRYVVVTDIDLRTEQTGLDFAAQWLVERPELDVVFMSGHVPEMISGFDDRPRGTAFVQKPFSFDQLERLLPGGD